MNLKKGDKIKIIKGPVDKLGKIGTVIKVLMNGAVVKLSEDWFTPIKFEHLQVIK